MAVITHMEAVDALISIFRRSTPAAPLPFTSLKSSDDRTHTASRPLLTAEVHSIPRRFAPLVFVAKVNTKAAKGIEENIMNKTVPIDIIEEVESLSSFPLLFGLTVMDEWMATEEAVKAVVEHNSHGSCSIP